MANKDPAVSTPESLSIPVATLKKWREALEPFWFSDDGEGESYNNDGVIDTCREIDALLKAAK